MRTNSVGRVVLLVWITSCLTGQTRSTMIVFSQTCLDRNPEAFKPKIGKGKEGESDRRHSKGCNCKRSGCLKNYCECYEVGLPSLSHFQFPNSSLFVFFTCSWGIRLVKCCLVLSTFPLSCLLIWPVLNVNKKGSHIRLLRSGQVTNLFFVSTIRPSRKFTRM